MKNILLKILCILVVSAIVQYAVFYARPNESGRMAAIRTLGKGDILYLGDSTIAASSATDTDRRSVAEFLEEQLRRRVVRDDSAGFNINTYLSHVTYLAECGSSPALIVMPVNMRSFSPQWDTNPMYRFKKDAFIAHAGLFRPLYKTLCTYTDYFRNDPPEKWLDSPVYDGMRVAGRVRDFEVEAFRTASPERIREKIIYHYRYTLAATHPKMAELRRICSLAREKGWRLLVYFTPIDMESCDAYCLGTSEQVRRNIATVKQELDAFAIPYLDMSDALTPDSFNWRGDLYPNEHLREAGRRYVATTLATAINRMGPAAVDRKMTE